jgi:hypothetical protein
MQTQLHFNVEAPCPEKMEPVGQGMRQPTGGLWTFSHDEGTASFIHWATTYDNMGFVARTNPRWYRMIGKTLSCWLLHPSADARIAVIDKPSDLIVLGNKYGWDVSCWERPVLGMTEYTGEVHSLNFPALARDYDAVHLTEHGCDSLETRDAGRYRLSNWHAESTCWFRWCFDRIEQTTILSDYLEHHRQRYWAVTLLSRIRRSYT